MLVSNKHGNVYGTRCGCSVSESNNWPVSDRAGCDHVIHRIRGILTGSEWLACDKGGHRCVTAEFCVVDGEIHCCIRWSDVAPAAIVRRFFTSGIVSPICLRLIARLLRVMELHGDAVQWVCIHCCTCLLRLSYGEALS